TTTLSGSFTDPGTLDTHTVVIDWGDGSSDTTVNLAAGVLTFSGVTHRYLDNRTDNDTYTLQAPANDKGGAAGTGTTEVTVINVAPTRLTLPSFPTRRSSDLTTTLSGSFTDPGTLDTHTVAINWGDGSSVTTVNLTAGVLTFSGVTHRYLDN